MFLDPDKPIKKHRLGLPHWHQDETLVFLTWRLADSLPAAVVGHLTKTRETWLQTHPQPWDDKTAAEYHRRFTLVLEKSLDDGHGSCCLREPAIRKIVSNALHHFDNKRYHLDSYVVMPNHVHVLLKLKAGHPIEDLMHSLKRHTAREINKALNQSGTLWQSKYWDRLIRSQNHLDWTRRYIADNPANLAPHDFSLWSAGL